MKGDHNISRWPTGPGLKVVFPSRKSHSFSCHYWFTLCDTESEYLDLVVSGTLMFMLFDHVSLGGSWCLNICRGAVSWLYLVSEPLLPFSPSPAMASPPLTQPNAAADHSVCFKSTTKLLFSWNSLCSSSRAFCPSFGCSSKFTSIFFFFYLTISRPCFMTP